MSKVVSDERSSLIILFMTQNVRGEKGNEMIIVWIAHCSRCHISRPQNTRFFLKISKGRRKKPVFLASLPSLVLCFQPRSRLFVGLEYAKKWTVLLSTIFLPRGLVGSYNCKFTFFKICFDKELALESHLSGDYSGEFAFV